MKSLDEYEGRAARKFADWRARHPKEYAEHEAYAYVKLNPPMRYRSGPLPGFMQMVLDELTRDSIRAYYATKQASGASTFVRQA